MGKANLHFIHSSLLNLNELIQFPKIDFTFLVTFINLKQ